MLMWILITPISVERHFSKSPSSTCLSCRTEPQHPESSYEAIAPLLAYFLAPHASQQGVEQELSLSCCSSALLRPQQSCKHFALLLLAKALSPYGPSTAFGPLSSKEPPKAARALVELLVPMLSHITSNLSPIDMCCWDLLLPGLSIGSCVCCKAKHGTANHFHVGQLQPPGCSCW